MVKLLTLKEDNFQDVTPIFQNIDLQHQRLFLQNFQLVTGYCEKYTFGRLLTRNSHQTFFCNEDVLLIHVSSSEILGIFGDNNCYKFTNGSVNHTLSRQSIGNGHWLYSFMKMYNWSKLQDFSSCNSSNLMEVLLSPTSH